MINRKKIGLIAEADSDIEVFKILISRIKNVNSLSFKHFVGGGSGEVRRKCLKWANYLADQGCSHLIIVHDLDNNNEHQLGQELYEKVKDSNFDAKKRMISIPIREIESWLISDPKALCEVFKIEERNNLKFGKPELIDAPKEKLAECVRIASSNEKRYFNTLHNTQIAKVVNINMILRKCTSFKQFYSFARNI